MSLPADIRRYFWEYDAESLSWPDSRETIIPKLLRDGGERGLDYLLDVMGANELQDWLREHDPRGVPPAQLRRLKRSLSLPSDWVEERIRRYQSSTWGRRTDG